MKTLYTIFIILITAILTMLCDFYICNPQQPGTILIDTVKTTIYKDSIQYVSKTKIKEIPKVDFVYLKDTIFVTDTIWIYYDYFTKVHYLDTIQNDSSAKIIISDTVFMNKLFNRIADVEVYNKTVYLQDKQLYLTLGAFYLQNSVTNSIGLKVGLNTLKNQFSIGYGTNNTYLFTYDYKLKIK